MNWPLRLDKPTIRCHEVLFSLNLVYALLIPWFLLRLTFEEGANIVDSYSFLRAAVRAASLLPISGPTAGAEIAFAATLASFAALVFLLLSRVRNKVVRGALFQEFAGLTAVFGIPFDLVYVAMVKWNSATKASFRHVPAVQVVAAELVCFGLILVLTRKRRFSIWALSFLMLLHFAAWASLLWLGLTKLIAPLPYGSLRSFHEMVGPALLGAVFPLSGLAWLLYISGPADARETPAPVSGTAAVAGALLAVAVLLVLWWPGKGYQIAYAANRRSLRVTMQRTGCYGLCPVYSVMVMGDGAVQYTGTKYVAVKGPQTSTLPEGQVTALAQQLDRINFFALEDRAFLWCFDTPRVSITVEVDGKQKTVSSDASCAGRKSGPQWQFVQIAGELDKLLDTQRWVPCATGHCSP